MNFSYKFPAVRGMQSGKHYYVSMIPLNLLSKLFVVDSEVGGPEFRAQRKLNEARIPAIKNYILANRDTYVFSALSASLDGEYTFRPYSGEDDIGILEVNMSTTFLINDGQHRKAAIEEALLEDPNLGIETISIVFFEDSGLERSQQMFTDLNKHAVKTSNSISTLYDSRDPLAVLTKDTIVKIPFLNLYTDKEKDNLGRNSSKLFTLTSIYKANKRIIRKSDVTEVDEHFLFDYWSAVAANIVEWQELMRKEINKLDLRQDYIICLNVTLAAFGRLGAHFYDNEAIKMKEALSGLQKIDWSRTNLADWGNRVIGARGKIMSNETAIWLTCNKVKEKLGIPLSKDELKKEER